MRRSRNDPSLRSRDPPPQRRRLTRSPSLHAVARGGGPDSDDDADLFLPAGASAGASSPAPDTLDHEVLGQELRRIVGTNQVFDWAAHACCDCQLASPESIPWLFFSAKSLNARGSKKKDDLCVQLRSEDLQCCNFPGIPLTIDSNSIDRRIHDDQTGVFKGLGCVKQRGVVHIHRVEHALGRMSTNKGSYEVFLPEIMYRLLGFSMRHEVRRSKRDTNQDEEVRAWSHCLADTRATERFRSRAYKFKRVESPVDCGSKKLIGASKRCLCNQKCLFIKAVHITENVVVWVGADCYQRFFEAEDNGSRRGGQQRVTPHEVDDFHAAMIQFDHDFREERRRRGRHAVAISYSDVSDEDDADDSAGDRPPASPSDNEFADFVDDEALLAAWPTGSY